MLRPWRRACSVAPPSPLAPPLAVRSRRVRTRAARWPAVAPRPDPACSRREPARRERVAGAPARNGCARPCLSSGRHREASCHASPRMEAAARGESPDVLEMDELRACRPGQRPCSLPPAIPKARTSSSVTTGGRPEQRLLGVDRGACLPTEAGAPVTSGESVLLAGEMSFPTVHSGIPLVRSRRAFA
jgi:hypothetical protein